MSEEVTIKIRAETEEATKNVQDFRSEMGRTKEATDRTVQSAQKAGKQVSNTASEFSKIGKDLGQISPTLGKITSSVTRLSQAWQKLGLNIRKARMPGQKGPTNATNDVNGPGYGLAPQTGRATNLGRIAGIAGIAAIGGSLIGSILGGGGSQLAGFDKLNAIGKPSIFDFLGPHLKGIKEAIDNLGKPLASISAVVAGIGALLGAKSEESNTNEDPAAQTKDAIQEVEGIIQTTMGNLADKWNTVLGQWKRQHMDEWETAKVLGLGTFSDMQAEAKKLGVSMQTYLVDVWKKMQANGIEAFGQIQIQADGVSQTISEAIHQVEVASDKLKQLKNGANSSNGSGAGNTPTPNTNEGGGSKGGLWDSITSGVADAMNWVNDSLIGDTLKFVQDNPILSVLTPGIGAVNLKGDYDQSDAEGALLDVALMGLGGAGKSLGAVSKLSKAGGVGDAVSNVVKSVTDTVGSVINDAGKALGDIGKSIGRVFGFAQGGVFQPNQPQLVWMGDNKTEPEVAAPYSLIYKAVSDALQSNSGGEAIGGSSRIEVPISLNGKVIARGIYDDLQSEERRRNGSAIR